MKKINFAKALQALAYRFVWPRNHECILCNHALYRYLPYRKGSAHAPPLMRVLGIIGSNPDQFECPWCGSNDRDRHLFLYMMALGFLPDMCGKTVLHFAPERRLSPCILAAGPEQYVKCDLFPQSSDVMRVDMLDMPFYDGSFDLLIANHVMEHVADDRQALAEICRVLKSGGFAILQTPYSSKLHHTWQDPGINTDEARLHAYGQEDHVRLYGQDIFERIETSGLRSCVSLHKDALPNINGAKYGVNEAEPFFLFQRPESP